jgi:predicted Zn-dependent protease
MKATMIQLWRRYLVLGVTALALAGCETASTTQGGVVGVDRQQRFAVSAEQIEEMADKQYDQVLAEARKQGKLNTKPAQTERVRAIAKRVIAQTPAFRPDAAKWDWEINVLDSPEVNAWAMPGGKIAVYSGLIEKLNVTDNELAAVIGHEIAHALREHSRERASEQAVAGSLISIASAVAGIGQAGQQGLEFAYQGLLGLPNSRRHEVESDRIGVELAARAGYDPRAAISLWEKMGEASGGEPPKFLSTHPSREDRIQDLRQYAERVMPLYQEARR